MLSIFTLKNAIAPIVNPEIPITVAPYFLKKHPTVNDV